MTDAAFVAFYAIIATAVGWIYFTQQQWPEFFDRNRLPADAQETLTLHLVIGAAAIGAAWPVALIFGLYGAYATLARRIGNGPAEAPASDR